MQDQSLVRRIGRIILYTAIAYVTILVLAEATAYFVGGALSEIGAARERAARISGVR